MEKRLQYTYILESHSTEYTWPAFYVFNTTIYKQLARKNIEFTYLLWENPGLFERVPL